MNTKTLIKAILALVSTILLCHSTRAASYLWNVASPGSNNWNVNANWLPGTGNPGSADAAVFGTTGTSPDALTVNNVVSVNTTVTSLTYTNTGVGAWHVTQIPAGITLTVNGATVMGNTANSAVTTVAFTDGGTLWLNGNLTMGNVGATITTSTVDFSGLSNFVYNASSGTILAGAGTRSMVAWKLAAVSNSITAATINDNSLNVSSSGTANTTLGAGTNIFNVGSFNIGFGRGRTTVSFPVGSTGGGLRIRGSAGTDASVCNMTLGNHNTSGSGSTAEGTLSLNGYPVDIRFGTLSLGMSSSGPTGNSPGNGNVSFDAGTIYASNIVMAVSSGTTTFAQANGTITVGASGRLTVGSGGISLASQSAASGAASGTLTINGGTVICSNSITKVSALGTGTINMSSGFLTVASGVIGSAAIPIDSLSMADSTLTLAVIANTTNMFVGNWWTSSTTNNTINISALPTILAYPAQFPLVRCASGATSDCLLGSLPAGYAGYLSKYIGGDSVGAVDLVVTSGPITIRPLVWNGTPTGDWNISTGNWLYLGTPTAYAQNDFVTFDDTASGTSTVNLTSGLTPATITVSNTTKNYTFNGAGSLDGAASLVKVGSGQLTLANTGTNTFTNGVTILGGKLLLAGSADRLPTGAIITLADVPDAMLDLNNLNQTIRSIYGGGYNGGNLSLGSATLTDSGSGSYGGVISGTGQLIKTNLPGSAGGTLTLTNANTYSGGTMIGGYTNNTTLVVANQTGSGTGSSFVRVLTNGSLYFGNGGPGGSVAAGVITNDGTVRLNRSDDFTFTNIIVGAGSLQTANANTVTITGTNGYAGGTSITSGNLRISNPGALSTGPIIIGNAAPGALQLTSGITVTNALIVASKPGTSGTAPNVENISDSNTLTGPISLTQNGASGWLFYATAGYLRISGAMTPLNASQTSQTTTRTLWLRGDAIGEWSSRIIDPVGGTTNLTLRKDGLGTWILSGANTYTAPTVVSNGTLLVNGSLAPSSVVTVWGGTLGGTGQINGPVTVNPEGTLSPGTSIGTLTISNSLTLNGTTVVDVAHTGCDKVAGIGSLTLGGTLKVVVNGTLNGSEVFNLFAATSYSGDFTSYDLPTLPDPMTWNTTLVPSQGILKIDGGAPPQPPQPTISPVTISGTNLVVSATTVSGASYVLQSATNLTPTVIWNNESTNAGTGGTLTINVPIEPGKPQKFLRFWAY